MAEMDGMIAKLRNLRELAARAAKIAAPEVQKIFVDNANAGRDPYGDPWLETKDGKKPLQHAAENMETVAKGTVITTTLKGHYYFHNRGTTKLPMRRILPGAAIPPAVEEVLQDAAKKAFSRTMNG